NLLGIEDSFGDGLPIAVGALAKETTPITFMASRASNLSHLKQERIVIAIDESVFHFLKIAGLFTLLPQALPGAAIVMSLAGFFGLFQRLFVHVGDHQNLARAIVLHNDRNKPVAFREIDFLHQRNSSKFTELNT